MQKVFVSHIPEKRLSLDCYEAWSREVDQRLMPGPNEIIRFETYAIQGAENGEGFREIVECIQVARFETFSTKVAGADLEYILETIEDLFDESIVQTVYRSPIPPGLLPPSSPPAQPIRLRETA